MCVMYDFCMWICLEGHDNEIKILHFQDEFLIYVSSKNISPSIPDYIFKNQIWWPASFIFYIDSQWSFYDSQSKYIAFHCIMVNQIATRYIGASNTIQYNTITRNQLAQSSIYSAHQSTVQYSTYVIQFPSPPQPSTWSSDVTIVATFYRFALIIRLYLFLEPLYLFLNHILFLKGI